jgi:hypothetical protein
VGYRKALIVNAKCTRHRSPGPVATALVELYVKVGRMRVLSSPKVVESAELIARRIVDTYLVPNKTFRAEFESLRAQF